MKSLELKNPEGTLLYIIEYEDYTDHVNCRAYRPGQEKPCVEDTIELEGRGVQEALNYFMENLP